MALLAPALPGSVLVWTLGALLAAAANAQPATVETRVTCDSGVQCHELLVDITLPSGKTADLSLRFEAAVNVTASSFRVTAEEVQPEDPVVQGQIPPGTFIDRRFPAVISIEANPSTAGLRFRGKWTMDFHTDAFDFEGKAPSSRLFHRHGNVGLFSDVTESVGTGSYRVRAGGGRFSEFVLLTDMRPPRAIATAKYLEIRNRLQAAGPAELSPVAQTVLLNKLQISQVAFEDDRFGQAINGVKDLVQEVNQRSGPQIADTWDPALSRESLAGDVRADAAALIFSLERVSRPASKSIDNLVRTLTTPSGYKIDLVLTFPQEVSDVDGALDIRAIEIDPDDPALLARLPANVFVPRSLPVMIHIGVQGNARPSFRGAWEIELRTRNLPSIDSSPFRLFSSPNGGVFFDVTSTFGVGPYLVRGMSGSFTDLIIATDKRSVSTVVDRKLSALEGLFEGVRPLIGDVAVATELAGELGAVRDHLEAHRDSEAIDALDAVLATVDEHAGAAIPDLFRQGEAGLVNAAGALTAAARSLQLSTTLRGAPRVLFYGG